MASAWRSRAFGILLILGLTLASEVRAAAPPDGWRIRMGAAVSGLPDKGLLTLGASSSSSDGFDAFDDPHPPALPHHFLDLVTRHDQRDLGWEMQPRPAMRYRAEYASPLGTGNRLLDFFLETDQSGPVTLTWSIATDLELAQHTS